jgi:alpha-tubulin suppressor-like RCC1 family protein
MVAADGATHDRNLEEPTLFASREHIFKQCAVGKDHCAMLTQDGKLMTMGSNDHGKLGHEPVQKVKLSNFEK